MPWSTTGPISQPTPAEPPERSTTGPKALWRPTPTVRPPNPTPVGCALGILTAYLIVFGVALAWWIEML